MFFYLVDLKLNSLESTCIVIKLSATAILTKTICFSNFPAKDCKDSFFLKQTEFLHTCFFPWNQMEMLLTYTATVDLSRNFAS